MSGEPVGFIGLGIMGKQMAQVLLKQGVELVVWNRSRQATEPLVALGARVARSPAEVVDECETTHAMVRSFPFKHITFSESKSVYFGRSQNLCVVTRNQIN